MDPVAAAHSASVFGKDRIALRQALEALEVALPAIDYIVEDMPGFDGVSWEAVALQARDAVEAIEERLLDG